MSRALKGIQAVQAVQAVQAHSQYPQTHDTQDLNQTLSQTLPVDPNYSMADTTQSHVPVMDQHGMGYSGHPSLPYQPHEAFYGGQASPSVVDSSLYSASSRSPSKEAAPMNPSYPQGVMGMPQEEVPSAVETPMVPQPPSEHAQYPQDPQYQGTYHPQDPYLHPASQPPATFGQSPHTTVYHF
ncbi:hypothetical protein GWK47_030591 [Chionoecetes opilio]|uniref:Uncharacterized protein n=1 Tax=Chionoecetes opilio TaxID=41210 RepID=A0A8J5D1J8_CHIOP|nr:hypothetical protein GWK47_030591 [Chionoecetes opilio]